MDTSVSWWDCGEFIATGYLMQVGHPPGSPFYQLLSHLFMLLSFGNSMLVAPLSNALSASDEVSMNRLTITVKVKFVNTKDPDADFEQQFSRYRDYAATLDFSAVESSLMSEIVTELCEDIFNKAVVNW